MSESQFRGEPVEQFRRKYKLGEELGRGSYSVVYKATDKANNVFAVKVVNKAKLESETETLEEMYQEVEVLRSLDHPNVIRCLGFYEDKDSMFLVTVYAAGGELFEKILERTYYNEENAKDVIRRLAYALRFCHSKGIVHRDLKPENILLHAGSDTNIVLADFGFATRVNPLVAEHKTMHTNLGTASYMSPELVLGRPYSYKTDVWALGVITFVLLSGNLPFGSGANPQLFRSIVQGRYNYEPRIVWRHVSPIAKDFVDHLLCVDVDRRYNYDQIINHEWLAGESRNEVNLVETLKNLEAFNEKKKEMRTRIKTRVALNIMKEFMNNTTTNT